MHRPFFDIRRHRFEAFHTADSQSIGRRAPLAQRKAPRSGARAVERVARNAIRTAPAVIPTQNGSLVAFEGSGSSCPNRVSSAGLTVLKIEAHPAPRISTAWCGDISGRGAPIATADDDNSSPIVWMVGAEGDNRLHGFRADTGAPVFAGGGAGDAMQGLRHFVTILAADERLFVAGDGRIYAFKS